MRHFIETAATRPRFAGRVFVLMAAALLAAANVAPATAATTVSGTGLNLLASLVSTTEHLSGYDPGAVRPLDRCRW